MKFESTLLMLKHTNANLILDHSYCGFTERNTDFRNETIELEPLHRIIDADNTSLTLKTLHNVKLLSINFVRALC